VIIITNLEKTMRNFSALDWVAIVVLAVGGLNWGMIAAFNIDLVSTLFGEMTTLTRIVYALVGVSAIYVLFAALYATNTSNVRRVAHS
jgi:uncharacterized membrane protein YuzA (DUF378 family)